MKKKIILICLPPTHPVRPFPSFSALKGFLKLHGYKVEILYLNVSIHKIIISYLDSFIYDSFNEIQTEFLGLLPFYCLIGGRYSDFQVKDRIQSYLKSYMPKMNIDQGRCQEIMTAIKTETEQLIDDCLDQINPERVLLVGFSSKFHQWVPGIFMAEKIKLRFPDLKIVIGGFDNEKECLSILKSFKDVDFAMWGEGEHSLLEFCRALSVPNGDYYSISRLAFRGGNDLIANHSKSSYVDLNEKIYPDYDDFLTPLKKDGLNPDCFPIESARGCYWNRCKFCFLNQGYKYRIKTPQNIMAEIRYMYKKYGASNFNFLDTDVVKNDMIQFEQLLDEMINLGLESDIEFEFGGEILHKDFSQKIIKKMTLAGFKICQIGYEAITDGLLKKMNKRTDFSDHILFLKFALKYGIKPMGSNIIQGIIGETKEDIFESIHNLVFLRFFLCVKRSSFKQRLVNLKIQYGSSFFKETSKQDLKNWNLNNVYPFLPQSFISDEARFYHFYFGRELENKTEWQWFENANKYYEENEYSYRILKGETHISFYEYVNKEQIARIVFDKPEYWLVLEIANDRVVGFDEILYQVKGKYPHVSKRELRKIIEELKSSYLLYANEVMTRIVSVIDTGLLVSNK